MIVIAGFTLTGAGERDAAVAAHAEMVARARTQDGCLDLSISADSVDAERINVFELRRDQEALDPWRKVARPPNIDRRATFVKLYRSDAAEDPF